MRPPANAPAPEPGISRGAGTGAFRFTAHARRFAVARQPAAASAEALLRTLLVPFAAVAAAAAATVFVVLLPICGIASIAEAIAKLSWRFVRATSARGRARGTMSRA